MCLRISRPSTQLSDRRPDSSSPLWVTTPLDGAYGGRVYSGSGLSLARRTLEIVRQRFPLAQLAPGVGESDALRSAGADGVDFIVSPEIIHWEDRASNSSGFRDKVCVEIRLLQVQPQELLSSTTFESRNNSITFINGRPADLLDKDYAEALLSLS